MITNLQEIKDNIDIVQVIQSYLPLRKNGANYISCCPFHNEDTPSFVVSKAKNIFHCFGCGEGGNGIDFIIKHENLDFMEALRQAARICSIEIQEEVSQEYAKRIKDKHDMQESLNILSAEQTKALMEHEKLLQYLMKRGFDKEAIRKYGIGYCLNIDDIQSIVGVHAAAKLGLIIKEYNFFQNRLMFAITDSKGNVVGFSGRIHDYANFTKSAKYINSKESILYKKSDILYNLCHAKELLKITKKVLFIVEGYFDALTCNLFKIPSIALCGTALNRNHLKMLSRHISDDTQIYLALDSDNAGREATIRAYKVCLQYGFVDIKIARLNPQYKDINELYISGVREFNSQFSIYEGMEYCLKVELGMAKTIKEKQEKLQFYKDFYTKTKDVFTKQYCIRFLKKYAVQEDIIITNQNKSEQDKILCALANDKEKRYIVRDVLQSDYFTDKEAFIDIMSGKQSAKVRSYQLQDADIEDTETFYKIVLRFQLFHLENERKRLFLSTPINYKLIMELNAKIQDITTSLEVPF